MPDVRLIDLRLITIYLYDIDHEQNSIFIPESNKVISIEKEAMDVIIQYKNKDGVIYNSPCTGGFCQYRQSTLIRTIKDKEISIKTISNMVSKIKDPRFKFNRIAEMGVYARLAKIEEQTGEAIKGDSDEFLKAKECSFITPVRYNLFKKGL